MQSIVSVGVILPMIIFSSIVEKILYVNMLVKYPPFFRSNEMVVPCLCIHGSDWFQSGIPT